jgi:hypothetical protein
MADSIELKLILLHVSFSRASPLVNSVAQLLRCDERTHKLLPFYQAKDKSNYPDTTSMRTSRPSDSGLWSEDQLQSDRGREFFRDRKASAVVFGSSCLKHLALYVCTR